MRAHDFIPDGWTEEQYLQWIDGAAPEGWGVEQWTDYVEEHKAKVDIHEIVTGG